MPADKTKTYAPSSFWWFRRPKYLAIFLRELGAVFILGYVLLYSSTVLQAHGGPQAYNSLIDMLNLPPFIALSVVMLFFTVFHAATWFRLSARIQPLKIGKKPIRNSSAFVLSIVIWMVVSYIVASLVLGV